MGFTLEVIVGHSVINVLSLMSNSWMICKDQILGGLAIEDQSYNRTVSRD
jgi:hypothetical protein